MTLKAVVESVTKKVQICSYLSIVSCFSSFPHSIRSDVVGTFFKELGAFVYCPHGILIICSLYRSSPRSRSI